ncbi:PaaX family transcriptional regulator C-terminal domain-containing protein [Alcanivorax sp. 24]|nr:PaaX family transcriptional regulator C-terminal domain-containing protein [Alcanivorax sp. 24]
MRDAWNLEQLSEGYREFLDQFRPLWQEMSKLETPPPWSVFWRVRC